MKTDYVDAPYDDEVNWRIVICIPCAFCVIRTFFLLTCLRKYDSPTYLLK